MKVREMVDNMMKMGFKKRLDCYRYMFGKEFDNGLKSCLECGGTVEEFVSMYARLEVK